MAKLLQQPLTHLETVEKQLYEEVARRQRVMMNELEEREKMLRLEREVRPAQIKGRSYEEVVKHPYNNHVWVYLANFINEDAVDLDGIKQRQEERQRKREEMESQKLLATQAVMQ
ncbi:unnamed protein product [Sphagnum balticum]